MAGRSNYKVGDVINGRRLVERKENQGRRSMWLWECIIHSGVKGPAGTQNMRVYSPQCCRAVKGENNPNWRGTGILGGKKYALIKAGAASRRSGAGIEFTITPQELVDQWSVQNGRCFYTGWDLVNPNLGTASVDRIHSSKGYVKGNVHWVHKDVNLAKQQLTGADFIYLAEAIHHHTAKNLFNIKDALKVVKVNDDRTIELAFDDDILAQYGIDRKDPRFKLIAIDMET